MDHDKLLREQLRKLLDWEDAHTTFDHAILGTKPSVYGVVPAGLPHSLWQLVEHFRRAQADILDFCLNPNYKEMKFPDDYWPETEPRSLKDWDEAVAAIRRDRKALQDLAMNPRIDLFARIPHGSGQTYLRELLLVADHNAYHVGQIVDTRRALGDWSA